MPIQDYVTDRRNKIIIGGLGGIGIIVSTVVAIANWPQPAFRVESPDGDRIWEVTTKGAIGVGSGASAFGSAGDCLKSGGGSGTMMTYGSCGSGGGSGTTYTAAQGLSLNGTAFSLSQNISGSLLEFQAVSGSTVYGSKSVRSSGSLVWEGSASGASLYVATSIKGAGLVDCDLSTQVLQWDETSGRFSCGTDDSGSSSFGSGNVIAIGDSRYVNIAGDTMTGALVHPDINGSVLFAGTGEQPFLIDLANNIDPSYEYGIGRSGADKSFSGRESLSFHIATAKSFSWFSSGWNKLMELTGAGNLRVTGNISNSGSLTFEGAASGSSLYVATSVRGSGLTDCDAATQTLNWDDSTGRFSCGTDSDTTYAAGQGLTLSSTSFRMSDSISGSLLEFQTVSGSSVYGSKSLRSSGALTWEGLGSGASLYVGGSLQGVGLTDCDIAGTSKLLWDVTTGRFSCGTDTDTDTNTTYTAGQGLSLNGTAFSLLAAHSGSIIKASTTLASSGTLVWEGAATGATLVVSSQFSGAGLVDCDLATQTLAWDAATNRFSCGTDSDTTYTAGQGIQLSGTSFRLLSSFSGSVIRATATLASSGTLVWEGAGSGNTLTVSSTATVGALTAVTLKNCAFLATNGSGVFSCGTLPTRTIVLTAGGGLPSALTGSGASGPERYSGTAVNDVSLYVLEFGNFAKGRYAMWTATMPDNYDGGTMTFRFNWKTAATMGDAKWYIQCRSLGDGEAIDQSWGTAVGIVDTAGGSANQLMISSATAAVTCAGTPAGGEVVQFRVYRDGGDAADTLADTGALISVKGEYVTNSLTD